ncbi:hypothetical protein ILUMI_17136 [Ignelater luminosus]|uniref:Pacifastin domain-containing protein n=1 Tax=Ignelater luminosus TaxID=2038154 RepID=A0A8K0CPN1_IGNLU|nr:hypothetical protein ILUMI_17136 [Ignelater luminosus]
MKSTRFLILFCGIAVVLGKKPRSGTFKCVHGVLYRENECNLCYCDRNQMLLCTSMACASHDDPKYIRCNVGTTWDRKCNQCWCTKGGGTICTAYQCDPKNLKAKKIS